MNNIVELEAKYEIEMEPNDNSGEINIALGAVALQMALEQLSESRPEGQSELSRRYAVTITELEKVYAYYVTYVIGEAGSESV